MVEKRKTKPKRKVKKKQPTQKQKQTQRQSVTVNINTKDLVKKKRKPRANVNSNTNRVLSQFSPPRSIVIPGNMINPSISGNMINPPTIPQMPMSSIFNPPPTFNKLLNPNPLQMGRNTDSVKLTGNVLGDVEREIKAREKYLADEQSLTGFSSVSGLTEDSLDRLPNYPNPPSTTGMTGSANVSINPLTFYDEPDTYSNITPPDIRTQTFRTESSETPSLSTVTFQTEPEPKKRKPYQTKGRKADSFYQEGLMRKAMEGFKDMGSIGSGSSFNVDSGSSLDSANFNKMMLGRRIDDLSALTDEAGMMKQGDDLSSFMSRMNRELDSQASVRTY